MEDYNYNNYNNMPDGQLYNVPKNKKPIWAAIVCFVTSLVNLLSLCCCSYILAPISLVFGIISLAKKWRGTSFAISGIVISAVTLVFMIISQIAFGEMSRDLSYIIIESEKYAEEYAETGEIPEAFEKYTAPEYDRYWRMFDCDNFYEFLDFIMSIYNTGRNVENSSDSSNDELDDYDFFNDDDSGFGWNDDDDYDYGELPIDI